MPTFGPCLPDFPGTPVLPGRPPGPTGPVSPCQRNIYKFSVQASTRHQTCYLLLIHCILGFQVARAGLLVREYPRKEDNSHLRLAMEFYRFTATYRDTWGPGITRRAL